MRQLRVCLGILPMDTLLLWYPRCHYHPWHLHLWSFFFLLTISSRWWCRCMGPLGKLQCIIISPTANGTIGIVTSVMSHTWPLRAQVHAYMRRIATAIIISMPSIDGPGHIGTGRDVDGHLAALAWSCVTKEPEIKAATETSPK